jgi:hypothetical protein
MKVDLLLAKVEEPAVVVLAGFEVKDAIVEGEGGGDACDGEDQMVDAVDLHGAWN